MPPVSEVGDIEPKPVFLWKGGVLWGYLGINWAGWCYVAGSTSDAAKWQFGAYKEDPTKNYFRVWNGKYFWHASAHIGADHRLGGYARNLRPEHWNFEKGKSWIPALTRVQPHGYKSGDTWWLYCNDGKEYDPPLCVGSACGA